MLNLNIFKLEPVLGIKIRDLYFIKICSYKIISIKLLLMNSKLIFQVEFISSLNNLNCIATKR